MTNFALDVRIRDLVDDAVKLVDLTICPNRQSFVHVFQLQVEHSVPSNRGRVLQVLAQKQVVADNGWRVVLGLVALFWRALLPQ